MVDQSFKARKLDGFANEWRVAENRKKFPEPLLPIQPNQQDVDFLVAYVQKPEQIHFALIEAKLTSGWDSTQFASKVARINAIKIEAKHRLHIPAHREHPIRFNVNT